MAFSVIAVSSRVSPFFTEEVATSMLMTSDPSRLAATSKLVRVRVEFSKKRLMTVRPASRSRRLSMDRFWSMYVSERSSKPEMVSGDRPSMPSKWGNLGTPARFFVTKAGR